MKFLILVFLAATFGCVLPIDPPRSCYGTMVRAGMGDIGASSYCSRDVRVVQR